MINQQTINKKCMAHGASHPGDFFYCLVDHAGMPGLHSKLINSRTEWISLFEGTKEAGAISVAPLLFRIKAQEKISRHVDVWTWFVERRIYASSLVLLASPLSMRELADRLTARLDATISDEMDVLLRFYDPRVFEQLIFALSSDQKNIFLSPATAWWYADRQGVLQIVEAKFSRKENFVAPLKLAAHQEQQLIEASEPDQIDEQLRLALPSEYANVPMEERHQFIVRHMLDAQSFRIVSTRELALYCSLALYYRETFARGSQWIPLLSEVAAGRRSLTDVVTKLRI